MKQKTPTKNEFKALIDSVGAETVRLLGDNRLPKINPQLVIPTGNLAIDRASSIGGFPRDRIIEIFGAESSGKTTVAGQIAAQYNKGGEYVLYVDFEHALDIGYFMQLGVNPDLFALMQPTSAEDALKFAIASAGTKPCGLVVIDSVAAITTKQELEGELDDANIGATARLMSRFIRKMAPVCSVNNTLLLCINQIRDKIGGFGYGPTTTQPGGRALKFAASMRIELARTQTNKDKGEAVSNTVKVKFVKNKLGTPYKEHEFEIRFGTGAYNAKTILEVSVTEKIIIKKGRTYSFEEEIIGTSEDQACQVIEEDEALAAKLLDKIKEIDQANVEVLPDAPVKANKAEVSKLKEADRDLSGDEDDEDEAIPLRSVSRMQIDD